MMTENQKKIGIGIAVAILCAIAFYFLYWVKTPTYSINLIRESVPKHDVATFEKHVDLDTLLPKAYDDAIVATDKISGENILANPFAAGMIQMMKPGIVSYFKSETIAKVRDDKAAAPAANSEQATMAKNLEAKTQMAAYTISDVSTISTEDTSATVALKMHHRLINKDFNLNVKMAKLDDGTWKVKEITNFVDFLVETDKAEKAKLAELNKPIKANLAKALQMVSGSMQLASDNNPFFASYALKYFVEVKNTSDKDIQSADLNIILKDKAGNVLTSGLAQITTPVAKGGNVTQYYTKELNQFLPRDAKIIQTDFSQTNWSAEVVGITFADGTSSKILEQLPDPNKK